MSDRSSSDHYGEPWNLDELGAAVDAYDEMFEMERSGERFVKAEIRRKYLAGPLSGRSDRSFEERMGNISFVRDEMGLATIRGYKPKPHVGSARAAQLRDMINQGTREQAWRRPNDDERSA